MYLELKYPSSIMCNSVCVVESLDKGFNYTSKSRHFNLPEGRYRIVSNSPLKIGPLKKYKMNRGISSKIPSGWNIKKVIGSHRGKGNVKWNRRNKTAFITIDIKIANKGICAFLYVLLHEHGHLIYGKNESKCDQFAENAMLKMGFNPSQILQAIIVTGNTRDCINRFEKHLIRKK